MIPLAIGIAIPDEHARLAGLDIDASHLAALSTAVSRHIAKMVQMVLSNDTQRRVVSNKIMLPQKDPQS